MTPPSSQTEPAVPLRRKRGFALLSTEDRKRISSLGGVASALQGVSHRFTREEASRAGKLSAESRNRQRQAKAAGDPAT